MARRAVPNPESRFVRAMWASPLLLFAVLGLKGLDLSSAVPAFQTMRDSGEFNVNGNKLPIRSKLYGIGEFPDKLVGLFAAIFTQMISGFDPISYWQTFAFITDYAGMYGVFLFESTRTANHWTPMYFATLWGILAQIRGISVTGPVYFFLQYILSSFQDLKTAGPSSIVIKHSWCVLPTVAISYLVPHFGMYLSPSLESRHLWTWIWQPFPIWGGIIFSLLTLPLYFGSSSSSKPSHPIMPYRTTGFFATLSVFVHWYTLLYSGLSPQQLWIPASLHPSTDITLAIRSCLLWDQLCAYGAGYVWLALQFYDLKRGMAASWSWSMILGTFMVFLPVFGPGSTFVLGWLVRERCLVDSISKEIRQRKIQ